MIPKKIHYCWFGHGELPPLAKKCIESWEKFCPEYEIIRWNEDNFDLNYNGYTQYCYENRKWAFLSDYARLVVIEEQGGIYFDTDVELLRKPDEFLKYEAFYGFENDENIATGLGFGAEAHHPTVVAMKREYDTILPNEEGEYPLIVCPALNTKALVQFGLTLNGQRQEFAGVIVLPEDFLNPYDDPTGQLRRTSNTLSVHWYSKSWMSKSAIFRSKLTKPFHRIFGVDCFEKLKGKKK